MSRIKVRIEVEVDGPIAQGNGSYSKWQREAEVGDDPCEYNHAVTQAVIRTLLAVDDSVSGAIDEQLSTGRWHDVSGSAQISAIVEKEGLPCR